MIHNRLDDSLSRIWWLLDGNYNELILFFSKTRPEISDNTNFFRIYLNSTENMSMIYAYGEYYQGDNLLETHSFKNFDSLKDTLSDYILLNLKRRRSSSLLRGIKHSYKPKKTSAPNIMFN